MAKLHFKYGAMNCGKSDLLIKTAYNYTERGLQVLTVKPGEDTKGGTFLTSRGGYTREVDILAHAASESRLETDVQQSIHEWMGERGVLLNCILTDESQFFSPSQIDQLYRLASHDNISVIAYGLKTNVYRRLFAGSQRLLELADNIEKIPTMCRCGSQAEFNARYIDGVFDYQETGVARTIIEGSTESVVYTSYCGRCYDDELAILHK